MNGWITYVDINQTRYRPASGEDVWVNCPNVALSVTDFDGNSEAQYLQITPAGARDFAYALLGQAALSDVVNDERTRAAPVAALGSGDTQPDTGEECDELAPTLVGAAAVYCTRRVGHRGPHRNDNGMEWRPVAQPDTEPPKCICDGGTYITKMPADWRPFSVSPQCVVHGVLAVPEPTTEQQP